MNVRRAALVVTTLAFTYNALMVPVDLAAGERGWAFAAVIIASVSAAMFAIVVTSPATEATR